MSDDYDKLKLAQIATRIGEHLRRIESDPELNQYPENHPAGRQGLRPYYSAGACAAGSRLRVWYVNYQGYSSLTKARALTYLRWLDAGNNGRHCDQQRREEQDHA